MPYLDELVYIYSLQLSHRKRTLSLLIHRSAKHLDYEQAFKLITEILPEEHVLNIGNFVPAGLSIFKALNSFQTLLKDVASGRN